MNKHRVEIIIISRFFETMFLSLLGTGFPLYNVVISNIFRLSLFFSTKFIASWFIIYDPSLLYVFLFSHCWQSCQKESLPLGEKSCSCQHEMIIITELIFIGVPLPLLPAANEVCEGYVFTPVCQSFCSQGGVPGQVHPQAGTPPSQVDPPGRYTPQAGTPSGQVHPQPQCMLGYGQQAGGTHPTGIHPCFCRFYE